MQLTSAKKLDNAMAHVEWAILNVGTWAPADDWWFDTMRTLVMLGTELKEARRLGRDLKEYQWGAIERVLKPVAGVLNVELLAPGLQVLTH